MACISGVMMMVSASDDVISGWRALDRTSPKPIQSHYTIEWYSRAAAAAAAARALSPVM